MIPVTIAALFSALALPIMIIIVLVLLVNASGKRNKVIYGDKDYENSDYNRGYCKPSEKIYPKCMRCGGANYSSKGKNVCYMCDTDNWD